MQTQNKLFDDLARVATSAMGVASGLREEAEARLREQFERILGQMDLVTRDEFETVRAMAAKAREEQEVLQERVAALEAKLAKKAGSGSSGRKRKTSAAKPSAAKPKES